MSAIAEKSGEKKILHKRLGMRKLCKIGAVFGEYRSKRSDRFVTMKPPFHATNETVVQVVGRAPWLSAKDPVQCVLGYERNLVKFVTL